MYICEEYILFMFNYLQAHENEESAFYKFVIKKIENLGEKNGKRILLLYV